MRSTRHLRPEDPAAAARRAYGAAYRERHPDRVAASQKRFYAAHPKARRVYNERWASKSPDKWFAARLRGAGITLAQYEAMEDAQGGVCAICRQPETLTNPKSGGRQRLRIDHDHACCTTRPWCGRCVRGLLCHRCNSAIGLLGDDPVLVRSALTYLLSPRATEGAA